MQPEPESAQSQPIDAESYNAVIGQLRPLDVRLLSVSFDVHPQQAFNQLQATASAEMPAIAERTELHDGTHLFTIMQRATFEVSAPGNIRVAVGRATFAVRIRVAFRPPENFWPLFLQRNVKLYTHPPLRDLVASLCARANIVVNLLDSVSVTQSIVDPALPAQPLASPRKTIKRIRPKGSE